MARAPRYKNHGQVGVISLRSEVQAGRMSESEATKLAYPEPIKLAGATKPDQKAPVTAKQ